MKEHDLEELSACMDGESGEASNQAIDRLLEDRDLRRKWMRYHLIADAMHQSLPGQLDPQLPAAVTERLSGEPTVLSPGRSRIRAVARPVAGLAIAASVAAIAILGLQPRQQAPDAVNQQPEVALTTFRPNIPPVRQFSYPVRMASVDGVSPPPAAVPVPTSSRQRLVSPRLNYYLVNHNEFHADAGMHGMLPYVRMVANGNND